MPLRLALLLLFLSGLCRPCLAQQDVFPERPVSWRKLVPNLAHDEKDIWLFPVSPAIKHHIKPVLLLTAITAGTIAAVDVPSGKYFQRTHAFDGFNQTFS